MTLECLISFSNRLEFGGTWVTYMVYLRLCGVQGRFGVNLCTFIMVYNLKEAGRCIVQFHFGVYRCNCVKVASNSKMAGFIVKWREIWTRDIINACMIIAMYLWACSVQTLFRVNRYTCVMYLCDLNCRTTINWSSIPKFYSQGEHWENTSRCDNLIFLPKTDSYCSDQKHVLSLSVPKFRPFSGKVWITSWQALSSSTERG